MKKGLLLLVIISALISCKNDNGGTKTKSATKDTVITLAAYMNYGLKGILYGPVRQIKMDSLMWVVGKDSATQKKEWTKYIYYEVPCVIQIMDSVTAKTFGVNRIDTVVERIIPSDARYVRTGFDYPDYDSARKELMKFVVYPDTTKKK